MALKDWEITQRDSKFTEYQTKDRKKGILIIKRTALSKGYLVETSNNIGLNRREFKKKSEAIRYAKSIMRKH